MISFGNIKTIFFDYDGTLHDSINIYAPAFRKAYDFLVEKGHGKEKQWSNKEISYWLGFNPKDMWQSFMPDISDELKKQCSEIIGEEMKRQIKLGNAVLYEGALETLEYLKNKDYDLIFISNCKIYYKEYHRNMFKLDRYFKGFICSEEYNFIPKHEIIKKVKHKYSNDMVIIGDRKQDIDAGKNNNIYTIGCTYGFSLSGELDEADMLIDNIEELRNYL